MAGSFHYTSVATLRDSELPGLSSALNAFSIAIACWIIVQEEDGSDMLVLF